MFFQGSYGNDIIDVTLSGALNGGGNIPLWKYKEAWRGENTSNSVPIITSYTQTNLGSGDLFLQDASYLRMKTIQLGYNLPQSFASKIHVKNLRIWLGGTNIFTITKYKGVDPEDGTTLFTTSSSTGVDSDGGIQLSSTAISRGIVSTSYPKSRIFTLGVNFTF